MQTCTLNISGKNLTIGPDTIEKWKFISNALHFKDNTNESKTIFFDEDYEFMKWVVAIVRDQNAAACMPQTPEFLKIINRLLNKYLVTLTDAKYSNIVIKDNNILPRELWIRLHFLGYDSERGNLIKIPANVKKLMFKSSIDLTLKITIERIVPRSEHEDKSNTENILELKTTNKEINIKADCKTIIEGEEIFKYLDCTTWIRRVEPILRDYDDIRYWQNSYSELIMKVVLLPN